MALVTMATQLTGIVEQATLGGIALPYEISSKVVYTKYESQDPMISDTQHGEKWDEQFTANDRLGITEDHGVIIDFLGTVRGEVGITPQGEVLDVDTIEIREEATQKRVPRFMAYDFRIAKLTKTDGPERRENLQRTYEQQRQVSETNVLDTISKAFERMGMNMGSGQAQGVAPASDLVTQLAALAPGQRQALMMRVEDMEEEAQLDSAGTSGKKGK